MAGRTIIETLRASQDRISTGRHPNATVCGEAATLITIMGEALEAAKRADKALDERESYREWEALDIRARNLREKALAAASEEWV